MSKQSNSDLLPYREVDRALKPKLPLLAGVMCVTPQHALGSLLEFWDLCADPRELERIAAEALAKNEEPAVLLKGADVEMRFELASGKRVEPVKLVMLGFLEQRDGGLYRVRGMSRDFKPIVRRLANRDAASKGGKKSAAARLAAHGTAQPQGGKGSKLAAGAASSTAQATDEAQRNQEPKRDRSESRSASDAERNSSGQRSAVSYTSSLRSEVCGDAGAPPHTPPRAPGPEVQLVDVDTAPDVAEGANGFWSRAQETRVEQGGAVREKPPHPRALGNWWSHALSEVGGDERRLWRAWVLYLADPHWRAKGCPWAGWVAQWEQFATRAGPVQSTTPREAVACLVCGCDLVPGDRGEHAVCGPADLPLCQRDVQLLVDECGGAVWADGWAKTEAAKGWLAGVRGRAA